MVDEQREMSGLEREPVPQSEETGAALLGYVLLLASPLFLVTGLIAVVIAYIYRDDAPEWLRSHYQLQIRTFWIGSLYIIAGTLLTLLIVGYFVLLFTLIWLLVRCIKGIRCVNRRRPFPNPESWWM